MFRPLCARARDPDARYFTAAEFAEALEVGARPVGVATPREVARYVEQKAATKLGAGSPATRFQSEVR